MLGGTIALRDLVQIRLITVAAGRLWQLKQADGQVLLIPVDAQGADSLFDAFASLPIDMGAVLAALERAARTRSAAALAAALIRLLSQGRAGRP